MDQPALSVVVVLYDMPRAAPRTLESLSAGYQRGISAGEYEVLVVDNGSPAPLPEEEVVRWGGNFRYLRQRDTLSSPARAVNRAIAEARGELVAILIDGARLVTPGLLATALLARRLDERPVIATLGWHLGPAPQWRSTQAGYDEAEEDRLLESIGWPADGYRLFEISVLASSSRDGWFLPIAESNALFLPRTLLEELGGLEEGFEAPGGGLVNLDLYDRACALPDARPILLLGEGSFHQVHGGATTSAPAAGAESPWERLQEEYIQLRGRPYRAPRLDPLYLGRVPEASLPFLESSARRALEGPGSM